MLHQLKWKVTALNSITTNDLNFMEWTRRVSTEHSDILKHMLKSSDVLDRAIAKEWPINNF